MKMSQMIVSDERLAAGRRGWVGGGSGAWCDCSSKSEKGEGSRRVGWGETAATAAETYQNSSYTFLLNHPASQRTKHFYQCLYLGKQ